MYVKGQGVPQDYTEALYLFNRAVTLGSADAEAELGYMYRSGYGVSPDYEQAIRMYRHSIQKGSVRGKNYLGEAYVCRPGSWERLRPSATAFRGRRTEGPTSGFGELG